MAYPEYYEILNVDVDANPEEIKQSYLRLVKQYHPDTHQGNQVAEEKLKRINEAYDVLKDLAKRAEYDYLGTIATDDEQFEAANVPAVYQPKRNVEQYQKKGERKSAKNKLIFKRILQFFFLWLIVAFIYVHRDAQDSGNVVKMLKNSSQTIAYVGTKATGSWRSRLENSGYWQKQTVKSLFYAVRGNHKYMLAVLLKYAPRHWLYAQNNGLSLLMEARDAEIAEMLIKAGADVNQLNDAGETALSLAVRRSDAVVTEVLLQAGANMNIILPDGSTPLQIAVGKNDTVIMALLQSRGAKMP